MDREKRLKKESFCCGFKCKNKVTRGRWFSDIFANYVRFFVCSIYFNKFVELYLFFYHFFVPSSRLVVENIIF